MSINEPAAGKRRGGLTKQQKRQAEAALYGLKQETNVPAEYSPQEIEQMRQLVLQNDISSGKVAEFDLNKPAKETYVHQEFPRIVYHQKSGAAKKVENAKEMEEALAKGFAKDPPPPPPPPDEGEQETGAEQQPVAPTPKPADEPHTARKPR